jgi:nucleoside-diphosphate-sugar epimerase
MLILIAGITGSVGTHAARHGLDHGHKIRDLGRCPQKLDLSIHNQIESFITSLIYYDIAALNESVKSFDAIVCASSGIPELALEGQLLHLRAAERAGLRAS